MSLPANYAARVHLAIKVCDTLTDALCVYTAALDHSDRVAIGALLRAACVMLRRDMVDLAELTPDASDLAELDAAIERVTATATASRAELSALGYRDPATHSAFGELTGALRRLRRCCR